MRQVPEIEIKNRLAFDNPWWREFAVDARFTDLPRRAYFDGFVKLVCESRVRRAVVLMGPRRVGKTVMIQQAVQRLIDDHVPAENIFYVSVDTPVYTGLSLEKLLGLFRDIHGHDLKSELYVFFDEIQYHPEWEVHLKSLVDSYPSLRFVASGSAAATLKMKSRESGAGRFTDFILPPLMFSEFLQFRGLEESLIKSGSHDENNIYELNEAFIDYLNFGGFPEAVMEEEIRRNMDRYIANDIIDKVLLRDLPSLYGISDTQELNRLFTTLAYNTGLEVNIDGLSKSSNVAKNTLRKYLDYLEAAFLIRRLYRVDQNARRFKRQSHFKVYLTNPCLRSALFGAVAAEDAAMGQMAETAVVSQYAHSDLINNLYYARWKTGEVDLVYLSPASQKAVTAMEVKWSDRAAIHPENELKAFVEFCRRAGPLSSQAVCTKTKDETLNLMGLEIFYFPVSAFCYRIGKTLVEGDLKSGKHPLSGIPFPEM
jgi:predicted AAA+ superfamily ATPase